MTSRFENEADETRMSNATEDETSIENEDESDQAKASSISLEFLFFFGEIFSICFSWLRYMLYIIQHYLESNEKYYLMAHR